MEILLMELVRNSASLLTIELKVTIINYYEYHEIRLLDTTSRVQVVIQNTVDR